jgi:hypothetical protein
MINTTRLSSFVKPRHLVYVLIFLGVLLSLPKVAWTQEITKVKGTQVLIQNFSGQTGETYFALDPSGKRRAIINIDKVKNGRAIGIIQKGKADVGYTLIARGAKSQGGSKSSSKKASGTFNFGGRAGYSIDSMSVPLRANTVAMSGSGFTAGAIADYNLSSTLGARLGAGYEMFSVTGSLSGTNYKTEISYFTLDALGRFFITDPGFALWIGAGVGFGVPMSKSTNILAEESIATSTLLILAGGVDWHLGDNFYIPTQVDYSMFLPATDVKTSIIAVKLGAVMKF